MTYKNLNGLVAMDKSYYHTRSNGLNFTIMNLVPIQGNSKNDK